MIERTPYMENILRNQLKGKKLAMFNGMGLRSEVNSLNNCQQTIFENIFERVVYFQFYV